MFDDKATSNIDLEEMAKKLDLPLIMVISKDQLPDKIQVGSYIINLEDSDEGEGTHWCLAKVFDKKNALWFDAFGQAAPREVVEFLKPYKPLPYSNRIIQHIDSSRCGLYCLACDHYMSRVRRKDMLEQYDDFLNMFVADTKKNDKILVDYLKKEM
jgi:hypothetical protein